MSSISIQHGGFHTFPSSEEELGASTSFSFPAFDGSSSSFAINPASQLPPSDMLPPLKHRAPRTSLIDGRSIHGGGATAEKTRESTLVDVGDEEDQVNVHGGGVSDRNGGVRQSEVWREIVASSYGRDKALKLIQYSIKVMLLTHTRSSTLLKRPSQTALELELMRRFDSTASGIGMARKCLLLFNWLAPLTSITSPQALPYTSSSKSRPRPQPLLYKFLHAPPPVLIDLLNCVTTDIATFSKLGLIGKGVGERAGRIADWCWFVETLIGLVEVGMERSLVGGLINQVESRIYRSTMLAPGSQSIAHADDEAELAKLRKQYSWLQVQRMKLLMDLIFVSYSVFNIQKYNKPAQALSGLASAVLSSAKLYNKQHTSLARSPS